MNQGMGGLRELLIGMPSKGKPGYLRLIDDWVFQQALTLGSLEQGFSGDFRNAMEMCTFEGTFLKP